MELINSKRILNSASHVSLKLSEEEQRAHAEKPAGALATVNLLQALKIDRTTQEQLGERLHGVAQHLRPALKKLLSAADLLERDPSAHLEVDGSIADVSAKSGHSAPVRANLRDLCAIEYKFCSYPL